MISKKFRLTRPEFILARVKGHVYDGQYFSARILEIPESGYPRYSVVISSKNIRNAVGRNRLRRMLYRCLMRLCGSCSGFIIIYPKPVVINFSHEEICSHLDRFLSEICP